MKDARAAFGMALAALMAVPVGPALASRQFTPEAPLVVTPSADSLVARGGGRASGGGSASGGRAAAGGNPGGGRQAGNRSGSRANNGFGNAGAGLNRGSTRPSGGWSNQVRPGASTGPSLDRANRPNRDRPSRDAI